MEWGAAGHPARPKFWAPCLARWASARMRARPQKSSVTGRGVRATDQHTLVQRGVGFAHARGDTRTRGRGHWGRGASLGAKANPAAAAVAVRHRVPRHLVLAHLCVWGGGGGGGAQKACRWHSGSSSRPPSSSTSWRPQQKYPWANKGRRVRATRRGGVHAVTPLFAGRCRRRCCCWCCLSATFRRDPSHWRKASEVHHASSETRQTGGGSGHSRQQQQRVVHGSGGGRGGGAR